MDVMKLDDQLCYALYSASMAVQRAYKPLLDQMGITYPQFLVLNLLWHDGQQNVGGLAEKLALESSTLTPLLKRLEVAGLVTRTRNPRNEREVLIETTPKGEKLKSEAGCLAERLVEASGAPVSGIIDLNKRVKDFRDRVYAGL
ncbi:MarR family winged helix-turn-helix transcriptional regulator [Sphingomonas asaccharolytica]|uniref:MarR family winged helix-turn-helix transcriptional regulator n=1 Tax=Sphingomonas asaccharolytica TaxID=40681 RepID=UPI00082AB43C|nr:MarR family transcriptional regulator [Sphingomonas asaccharolytica]